jgi:hypothetical protein
MKGGVSKERSPLCNDYITIYKDKFENTPPPPLAQNSQRTIVGDPYAPDSTASFVLAASFALTSGVLHICNFEKESHSVHVVLCCCVVVVGRRENLENRCFYRQKFGCISIGESAACDAAAKEMVVWRNSNVRGDR